MTLTIISWIIIIIGLLFIFDIPQKIYYAIKKQSNQIKEVEPDGRTCYYDRDDINND